MIHMYGEGTNVGYLQHLALPEGPNPTGYRDGKDCRVLAECVPSGRGSVTGP